MPYEMDFYVDGACRRNGQRGAAGAAAACLMEWDGGYYTRTELIPSVEQGYVCTNQRAELKAVIIALKWALEERDGLRTRPYMIVNIHSDSRYAIGCMSNWIYEWRRHGWMNTHGVAVVNRDLIEEAADLEDELWRLGRVKYIWVHRDENYLPDKHCNEALNAAAVVPPRHPMMGQDMRYRHR